MSKPLAITQKQITAICKGAKAAGCIAELTVNGIVVRLVPESHARSVVSPSVDEHLDALFAPAQAGSRSQPPYDDAVNDYYKKLGYDPRTMNDDDFIRLVKEADARWKAEIPSLPLNKRERTLLANLAPHAGQMISTTAVKGAGPDTVERLIARKFVDVVYRSGAKSATGMDEYPDQIMLTADGLAAISPDRAGATS